MDKLLRVDDAEPFDHYPWIDIDAQPYGVHFNHVLEPFEIISVHRYLHLLHFEVPRYYYYQQVFRSEIVPALKDKGQMAGLVGLHTVFGQSCALARSEPWGWHLSKNEDRLGSVEYDLDSVVYLRIGCPHKDVTVTKLGYAYHRHYCEDCGYTWDIDSGD